MKAVIFDLDGVLVFTDKYHYSAWKKIADKIGVHFDEKINDRLRGVSRAESLEIILENYSGNLTECEKFSLTEEKNSIYKQLLESLSPEDIEAKTYETLINLRNLSCKLAVGSSSKNAGFILEKVRLSHMFDAVADGNIITHSKPHPDVFLKAAELINKKPCDCIVVEDARAGIDAAKAAGMTAIAIGDATGYEKSDYSILSVAELPELVSRICTRVK